MIKNSIILFLLVCFLPACSKKPQTKKPLLNASSSSRYSISQDRAPNAAGFEITHLDQWDIKPEGKSRYGNHSPYIVFGKTYHLADTSKDFEQTGTASWYGKKFHDHTTSNMEIFDMYKLTAAHRTLPLPSYVEVTNLANNKKVVVRVNDRGPFKSKRIIDLSWAAAKVLGYDKKGLANVHIRLIQAPGIKTKRVTNLARNTTEYKTDHSLSGLKYLQVGAYSKKKGALKVAKEMSQIILLPVHISSPNKSNPLYKVKIGPLSERDSIIDIIQQIHRKGYTKTKMVVE